MDYKYIVIGRGIMGSAGAFHLASSISGVALIGPSEAMGDKDSTVPKSSHNDVGRITRMLDPDPFWGSVARRSIGRYREHEQESGVRFFNQCGFLWMDNDPTRVNEMANLAADEAIETARLTSACVREKFSFLSADGVSAALYQNRESGSINPRAYVQAMASRAQTAGAKQIDSMVIGIKPTSQGVTLETAGNSCLSCEKILITTGAYGAVDHLIDRKLPLKARKTGVILIAVPRQTVESRFINMPCIISRPPPSRPNTYLLPPLKYPDGRYYLKIGIAAQGPPVESTDELNQWLLNGRDHDISTVLLSELNTIIPNLNLSKWKYMPCATSHTPDARPIIDIIGGGRIGLLLGGNGFSAKSGDALGELGASLMLGSTWPKTISKSDLSLARFS